MLLLDEPVAGLDPEHRERVTDILRRSPLTTLVVSHDRAFLQEVTQRMVNLHSGRLEPLLPVERPAQPLPADPARAAD